jgi:hypothetical protein
MTQYCIFERSNPLLQVPTKFETAVLDASHVVNGLLTTQCIYSVVKVSDEKKMTFESLQSEEHGRLYMSEDAFQRWINIYGPLFRELRSMTDRYENQSGDFKKVRGLLEKECSLVMNLWEKIPHNMEYSPDIMSYFFYYGWVEQELNDVMEDLVDRVRNYYLNPN